MIHDFLAFAENVADAVDLQSASHGWDDSPRLSRLPNDELGESASLIIDLGAR